MVRKMLFNIRDKKIMQPNIVKGGSHTDHRGTISFINDFDMNQIKRFYIIEHPDTETVRGWRGHKIEQRWFYVTEGTFVIDLVRIDDFESPSVDLPVTQFKLSVKDTEVLHVPVGYASSIKALTPNSKLIVFADYGVENAPLDDYLYPVDYFQNKI